MIQNHEKERQLKDPSVHLLMIEPEFEEAEEHHNLLEHTNKTYEERQ